MGPPPLPLAPLAFIIFPLSILKHFLSLGRILCASLSLSFSFLVLEKCSLTILRHHQRPTSINLLLLLYLSLSLSVFFLGFLNWDLFFYGGDGNLILVGVGELMISVAALQI